MDITLTGVQESVWTGLMNQLEARGLFGGNGGGASGTGGTGATSTTTTQGGQQSPSGKEIIEANAALKAFSRALSSEAGWIVDSQNNLKKAIDNCLAGSEEFKETNDKFSESEKQRLKKLSGELEKQIEKTAKWADKHAVELAEEEAKRVKQRTNWYKYEHGALKKVFDGFSGLMSFANAAVDALVTYQRNNLKKAGNTFSFEMKKIGASVDLASVSISNSARNISTWLLNDTIGALKQVADTAYSQAEANIQFQKTIFNAEQEFRLSESQRRLDTMSGYASAAGNAINAVASFAGPMGKAVIGSVNQIAASAASGVSKEWGVWLEGEKQAVDFANSIYDAFSNAYGKAKETVSVYNDLASSFSEEFTKFEDAVFKAAASSGFGSRYLPYMTAQAQKANETFPIDIETLLGMQKSYASSSGRNILVSGGEATMMEGLSRAYGTSQSEVSGLMGNMFIFNKSVKQGYDLLNESYKVIMRSGIESGKFMKSFTENLRLAQKYNFRGGLDNLRQMTEWAEKTRFNLGSAQGFADKMNSNNISDIISTSARLQVLGGSAAAFSDPFAMMWEAGNDYGAFAKRISSFYGDIKPNFNSRTGEFEFGNYDRRRIREISDITGQSQEDVYNQLVTSAKKERIAKNIGGRGGLKDSTLDAIAQRATFENGQFVVKTIDGGTKTVGQLAAMGDKAAMDVMLPVDTEQGVINIAQDVRSMNDLLHRSKLLGMYGWMGDSGKTDAVYTNARIAADNMLGMYDNKGVQEIVLGQIEFIGELNQQAYKNATELIEPMKELVKSTNDVTSSLNTVNEETVKDMTTLVTKLGDRELYDKLFKIGEMTKDSADAVANALEKVLGEGSMDEVVRDVNNVKIKKRMAERLESKDNPAVDSLLSSHVHFDGVGDMNGGYIVGASNVRAINDGIVRTHPDDQYMAAKPDGPIDKLFGRILPMIEAIYEVVAGRVQGGGDLNMSLNGTLKLAQDGSEINLVDAMKRNPLAMRDFITLFLKESEIMNNGRQIILR